MTQETITVPVETLAFLIAQVPKYNRDVGLRICEGSGCCSYATMVAPETPDYDSMIVCDECGKSNEFVDAVDLPHATHARFVNAFLKTEPVQ